MIEFNRKHMEENETILSSLGFPVIRIQCLKGDITMANKEIDRGLEHSCLQEV